MSHEQDMATESKRLAIDASVPNSRSAGLPVRRREPGYVAESGYMECNG